MPPKTSKKTKSYKSNELEINPNAVRILRTLNNQEAFYFYNAIGTPTGECARSLSDFAEKIKSVKLESLLFHLQRKDFYNWISTTIGDPELARRIEKTVHTQDDVKAKIHSTIERRIKELAEESTTLLVATDLVLTP